MFRCQQCGSTQFSLQVQPGFSGQVDISLNEAQDVIIQAGTQRFVADLMFINRFGICDDCGETKHWEYHYPIPQSK